ncbi:DNA polymerase nu-like [Patiria miniata]|uniref:DNA-directed DNA polymerase n=1 Tax=Patiria miniata TaxID=46514 RepID=A0A914B6V0_PATMI|nr:DNA polymerase nu-like [Patiria miniata]
MCPVWTPLNPPPRPDEVWDLSDDARIILRALREAHKKKRESRQQSQAPPDPKTYYRSLYRESFKQESPRLSPKENCSGEQATQTSSNRSFELGQRIKVEQRSPQGSPEPPVLNCEQNQASTLSHFISAVTQNTTWCRDCSQNPGRVFSEELFRTGRPVDELLYSARISASAVSHMAGFNLRSPRKGQGGEDSSPVIPDSLPIDTKYYQEFDKNQHGFLATDFVPNSCREDGPGMLNKSRETRVEGTPNPKERGLEKGIEASPEKRPRHSVGNNSDILEQVQSGAFHSGKFASKADWPLQENLHPIGNSEGVVAPQIPLAEMEDAGTRHVGCKPDSTPIPAHKRSFSSDVKIDEQSHHGLSGNQKAAAQASTLQKNKAMSKAGTCKRKAGQPTIDEIFGYANSAMHRTGDLIRNVSSMTSASREEVSDRLARVDEVSMCIMYKDGSSQLREPNSTAKKRKGIGCSDGTAECLVLAYEIASIFPDDGGSGKHPDNKLDFISIPLCGKQESSTQEWSKITLLNLMRNQRVKKICFDAQEMIHTVICSFSLDHAVVSSHWLAMDPKVAAWLIDADHPPITFTDLLGKYLPDQASQSETRMKSSICVDLPLLGAIMKHLFHLLSEASLWQLFLDVEMRLCPILAVMEVQGIRVQSQTLQEYGKLLQSKSRQVELEAHEAAGRPFQITSHTQLRQVLFEELRLDKKYQGRKLARTNVLNLKSTSETVLLKLQDLHPLPKLVLQYRQLAKLKSTYIDGILDCIEDGYIHTSWEQTSAATGRLQSANPNIQNIPKQPVLMHDQTQTEESEPNSTAILARKPFVSRDGWSFVAADFQSIELRLLAHLSHDPVLVRAFNKQDCTDIFVELASQWLGVPTASVTSAEREKTKRIVYSVIYGVGPDKLAETLGVSREEAKSFTRSFLSTFRGVSSFTKTCISCCQRHGFVQTIFRRRRLIPNINSVDFHIRSHAERQCVNFVVQGSAADICKVAMIQVVHALAARPHLNARLAVQIHDELLLEVAEPDVEEVKGIVKSAMEVTEFHCGSHVQLQVPLPVSISVGKNWGQLQ